MRNNLLCTILLLLVGLFLVGCGNAQPTIPNQTAVPNQTTTSSQTTEPPAQTIFGRLSQYVQLGSTQESIAYKLESGSFFVTVRGEVLMRRSAEIIIAVTERESGIVRDDLNVTFELCHAVDEDLRGIESCSTFDGPLYRHKLATTVKNGFYHTDTFDWERAGNWSGMLTITQAGEAQVEEAQIEEAQAEEAQTLEMNVEVYPARPPSTNLFELSSISLPFAVIGLFLLGLWFSKGRFIRPTTAVTGEA